MNLIVFSGPRNCVNTQYAALSGAMTVWQHPNEPRGLNQSEFELNIEKKNMTEIFLCPQRNFGRHIVIALSVRPASCLVHISYILCGRNSEFGVWMHLGMAEARVPFSGLCDLDLT